MITWDDNPRIDIEKRIKQLNARIKFLLRYRRLGGIDYVNGAAARFYPSLTPKKQYDKSGRLLVIARAELSLKWKQLKSF